MDRIALIVCALVFACSTVLAADDAAPVGFLSPHSKAARLTDAELDAVTAGDVFAVLLIRGGPDLLINRSPRVAICINNCGGVNPLPPGPKPVTGLIIISPPVGAPKLICINFPGC